MTSWLGNVNGKYANLQHKAELAEYDFLATFFIYHEMNAICVGQLDNNPSCIQFSNELLIAGTVQDVMPIVLHSIGQSNHSACSFFHQQTIIFIRSVHQQFSAPFVTRSQCVCMPLTSNQGLKTEKQLVGSYQLYICCNIVVNILLQLLVVYQTASRACYAKSVCQISSQLASFQHGKNQLLHYLRNVSMI